MVLLLQCSCMRTWTRTRFQDGWVWVPDKQVRVQQKWTAVLTQVLQVLCYWVNLSVVQVEQFECTCECPPGYLACCFILTLSRSTQVIIGHSLWTCHRMKKVALRMFMHVLVWHIFGCFLSFCAKVIWCNHEWVLSGLIAELYLRNILSE